MRWGSGNYRRITAILALAAIPALAGPPELTAPYRAYSLPLSSYAPTPGRIQGLLVRARVNGGPPLRLLLDTGADDIVLNQQAARRSGLSTSAELIMVCAGAPPSKTMKSGMAQTLDVGPLSFRNYPVNVTALQLGEGLDGVVPLNLFRGFLVRLDLARKILELSPYSAYVPGAEEGFVSLLPGQDLLFVRATLNRTRSGYVMLDTGSSYTAVSHPAAQALKSTSGAQASVRAADGAFTAHYISAAVQFQAAGEDFRADSVLALDLTNLSRFQNVDVSGLLGYPELRTKVLTVNYRDSLVKIEASPR